MHQYLPSITVSKVSIPVKLTDNDINHRIIIFMGRWLIIDGRIAIIVIEMMLFFPW